MQIGVDIGGTFTDLAALDRDRCLTLTKVPSTPKDLLEGIAAAVQRVLRLAGATPGAVERFIHGTIVATDAILEHKSAVTAVLATEGFEDVLEWAVRSERGCTTSRLRPRLPRRTLMFPTRVSLET